jgi:hypothetical protein
MRYDDEEEPAAVTLMVTIDSACDEPYEPSCESGCVCDCGGYGIAYHLLLLLLLLLLLTCFSLFVVVILTLARYILHHAIHAL